MSARPTSSGAKASVPPLKHGLALLRLSAALELYEYAITVMDPKSDREALRSLELEIDLAEMELLPQVRMACSPTAPAK